MDSTPTKPQNAVKRAIIDKETEVKKKVRKNEEPKTEENTLFPPYIVYIMKYLKAYGKDVYRMKELVSNVNMGSKPRNKQAFFAMRKVSKDFMNCVNPAPPHTEGNVHHAFGILRQYLRTTPKPILPVHLYRPSEKKIELTSEDRMRTEKMLEFFGRISPVPQNVAEDKITGYDLLIEEIAKELGKDLTHSEHLEFKDIIAIQSIINIRENSSRTYIPN